MDITQHTYAAIVAITQYEATVYANDPDAARGHLLDTMRHIIAITKQTPAAPAHRPHDLGRPERTCRYHRIVSNLTGILPIPGSNIQPHNHLSLAWFECVELCRFHGWMPPTPELATRRPLLQQQALARR